MASQAYQTLTSLLIYVGTGTVAQWKTDPVLWAQTPVLHQPVEAHFHTPLRLSDLQIEEHSIYNLRPVEPKTGTYHGRVGSGRPADGGAGSGRTGCQQN